MHSTIISLPTFIMKSMPRAACILVRGAESMASRFNGAVVGAVVGDCLGSDYEFSPVEIETLNDNFTKINAGDQPQESYQFTDDTAMARSVAYSLIKKAKADPEDLAKRFVYEFLKEPGRGYGASVGKVFLQLKNEKYAEPFGPAARQFDGSGSYGNGGAMRIVPAALFGYKLNKAQLLQLVDSITKITHSHPDAVNGARLQCAAVHSALHLQAETPIDTQAFADRLIEFMSDIESAADNEESNDVTDSPKQKRLCKEDTGTSYTKKLKLIKGYLKQEKEVDRSIIEDTLGNDVSALESVPAAIYSFLRATNPISSIPVDSPFERTIIYAISLGGDTDTIATMAGAMAGAYYGVEQIPESWKKVCEGVADAMEYGEKLHDHSCQTSRFGGRSPVFNHNQPGSSA